MTQEELDALLNESVLDTMEDGSANKEEKAENSSEKEAEIKTAEGIKTEGFHIDSETSWPPPRQRSIFNTRL